MTIAVVLYTYAPADNPPLAAERQRYAEATLKALFAHLKTQQTVHLHIADDGSAPEYREHLWELAGEYAGANRSITNSERRGYGGNYNQASWFVHQMTGIDAILHSEDDWILTRDFEVDPLVDVLQTDSRVGCIRLGYIGYTRPLRAEFIWTEGPNPGEPYGQHHFLLLDPNSPSQYVWSGHPRLETVAWARSVGPWREGIRAGEVELDVCGRTAARTGVAWPVDLIPPRGGLFEHIGTAQVKDAPLREGVRA